jgi:ADP-heptose:LPS heptosyltransferase
LQSTSCREIAQQVLEQCIAGKPPKALPHALIEEPCSAPLFSVLVEGLADRFEPALCDAYARLFSQAIAHVTGEDAGRIVSRYEYVRRVRPVHAEPKTVVVLSRVTLGADVAVTSVLLAAAKQRFPKARVVFAGPRKNYELFAADRAVEHAAVDYPRGSLRERLAAAQQIAELAADADCLVIDPDSRLTQSGLLAVCPEEQYRFFESRGYCPDSDSPLPELAGRWAEETLGVSGAKPYVALAGAIKRKPRVAVSLGVGENPAKRIGDPFEERLLLLLAKLGLPIAIDKGAGGAEAERVQEAVARSGAKVEYWEGSFAGFASIIAGSSLYVGYDSAGQHVAAACGVPSVVIFAGFPAPRMFERWRPAAAMSHVIRVDDPEPDGVLARVSAAVRRAVAKIS